MKVEYEIEVMKWLYLIKLTRNADLPFTSITKLTKIPNGTLQRILPRLEKRGWIKRKEKWIRIPTSPLLYDVNNKAVLEIAVAYRKALTNKKGSYERRKTLARKAITNGFTPKEVTVFKILMVPYLFGDKRGKTVPEGSKREWRLGAQKIKQTIREYKNTWQREKKKINRKIKSLNHSTEYEQRVLREELRDLEARKARLFLIEYKPPE